jgi:competence protein ComEC
VAIYAAGAGNSYGHPHAEVVERLAARGTQVYGTDVHGTVVVTTDGTTFEVTTERNGTPAPGDLDRSPGPDDDPAEDTDVGAGDTAAEDTAAEEALPEPAPDASTCAAGQVDINRADIDTLQDIIHIGPERAGAIISSRPFPSVGSLTRLDGIGPARINDIVSEGIACVG